MGLPKILVGGVLIIDLSTLSITPSVDMETYTTISNSEILSQLERLKQYIGNPTAQKPLWVRMSYDGEMITTMGALYKEDGDPHFKLVIKVMDYRLLIDVTFTQDEETLEWYIDTGDAKYLFTSNSQEVDSYIADSISSGAIKSALDLKANLTGASFTGNVSVGGALSVTGDISGDDISGNSIIENMTGYSFNKGSESTEVTRDFIYAGVVKTGNKITFVIALNLTRTGTQSGGLQIGQFVLPQAIKDKIYPSEIGGYSYVDVKIVQAWASDSNSKDLQLYCVKNVQGNLNVNLNETPVNALTQNTTYYVRYELTLLLSDNLIPTE